MGNRTRRWTVEATTIDRVLMPSGEVDLMKIDVEGAELRVLRGAVRTLETMKPKIIVEVHPSHLSDQAGSVEEITNYLSKKVYDLLKIDNEEALEEERSNINPEMRVYLQFVADSI